jgi:hypothetical protein
VEVRLQLTVKGQNIELSEQDAIELRDVLVRLTGGVKEHYTYIPTWNPPYPWEVKPYPYPQYPNVVWCSGTGSTLSLSMVGHNV